MAANSEKKLLCPICDRATTFESLNPFRPFCSEKCQLIDLGNWLSEKHFIPGQDTSDES